MIQTHHLMYPRTINKKLLCEVLGLTSKNGNIHYTKLRKHYLTDAILVKLNILPGDYKAIRIFNIEQTALIIEEMDLNPQEFEDLKNKPL